MSGICTLTLYLYLNAVEARLRVSNFKISKFELDAFLNSDS